MITQLLNDQIQLILCRDRNVQEMSEAPKMRGRLPKVCKVFETDHKIIIFGLIDGWDSDESSVKELFTDLLGKNPIGNEWVRRYQFVPLDSRHLDQLSCKKIINFNCEIFSSLWLPNIFHPKYARDAI